MKRIGYWTQNQEDPQVDGLLWPGDLVDFTWDSEERARVVLHLFNGKLNDAFRGPSRCRLCPGAKWNGTCDQTDGTYIWPEGFAHYIAAHGVKPPQEFIDHVNLQAQGVKPHVLPNGFIQGSPEDRATWWTCSACSFKGPYVGSRPDGTHGCLGSCGGTEPNPSCTWRSGT